MIDKEIAKKLLPLVHNEFFYALMEYVEYRKNKLAHAGMIASDREDVKTMQGAYHELLLLGDLQKWVEQDSRDT